MSVLSAFIRDERAATSIEYAMVGALISIAVLTGAKLIGINLSVRFLGPLANGFP
jgi:pilus assembly protein Flp/PilA